MAFIKAWTPALLNLIPTSTFHTSSPSTGALTTALHAGILLPPPMTSAFSTTPAHTFDFRHDPQRDALSARIFSSTSSFGHANQNVDAPRLDCASRKNGQKHSRGGDDRVKRETLQPLISRFLELSQYPEEYARTGELASLLLQDASPEALKAVLTCPHTLDVRVEKRIASSLADKELAERSSILKAMLKEPKNTLFSRLRIIELMGKLGDESVLPILRDIVQNREEHSDILFMAARILWMRSPHTLDFLIETTSSPSVSVRESAIQELRQYRDPRAIEALLARFEDPWYLNAVSAACALSEYGEAILPRMRPLLQHSSYLIRWRALMTLERAASTAELNRLLPSIAQHDDTLTVRHAAARMLQKIQGNSRESQPMQTVPVQTGGSRESLTPERTGRRDNRRIVSQGRRDMREILAFPPDEVIQDMSVTELLHLFEDFTREPDAYALSIELLEALWQRETEHAAKAVLTSPYTLDPRVEGAIADSLSTMDVTERSILLKNALQAPHNTLFSRLRIIELMGKLGDESVLPLLKDIVQNREEHSDILFMAAHILWMRSPHTLDFLIEATSSPSVYVRESAIQELGQHRDPRAIEALLARFEDPWYLNAVSAACALSEYGEAILPHITPLLQKPSYLVRWRAIMTLGLVMQRSDLMPLLMPIVHGDESETVRSEATKALSSASYRAQFSRLSIRPFMNEVKR